MPELFGSISDQVRQIFGPVLDQVRPSTLLDIGITAVLVYWLFSLIRGTRAVRLVIGVSVLFLMYGLAQALDLRLVTQILQTGAVVGVFAFVVVFQPELRRGLERIGRVGSFAWLISPSEERTAEHVSHDVARAASVLSAQGYGALIVLERETGLEEIAESGVMIHGDLSTDLLETIFMRGTALHDGAVIIRGDRLLAAGALLPLAELTLQSQRFGTRHRAALGITEQTDAVVVVVSEENSQVSLVERARIRRNLNEPQLARALASLLNPAAARRSLFGRLGDRDGERPRGSRRLGSLRWRRERIERDAERERSASGERSTGAERTKTAERPASTERPERSDAADRAAADLPERGTEPDAGAASIRTQR